MKTFSSFLALAVLPLSLSFAQNQPSATTTPATGRTTATTSSTASSTNRQQELYDQYHGITKKPATATTTTTAPVRTEPAQPAREMTRTQPTATASSPRQPSVDGSTSGVRIGVRGGATYTVFTQERIGFDPKVGFVGGVSFNFGGGGLSFQPEVNYARYSYKVDLGFGPNTSSVDVIEVPLFLKIASGTYAGNRFFVNVGPYGSYLLSISTNGKTQSLDGLDGRFAFGAAAGVGTALKAGPGHVTVEVRGLYPLGNTTDGFSTDSNTILSQATIGYIFPLGGR